jgi:hypothetical protein
MASEISLILALPVSRFRTFRARNTAKNSPRTLILRIRLSSMLLEQLLSMSNYDEERDCQIAIENSENDVVLAAQIEFKAGCF